jgi:hypothetical protein
MPDEATGFAVCPPGFGSCFGMILAILVFLPFGMAMFILYHCIVNVCNLV